MIRQVWVFMEEADEQAFLAKIQAEAPISLLRGRYFRGDEEELREAPESLETRQLSAREHRTQLIHRDISKKLVIHHHQQGPFAGWSSLDEARSEVLTLIRPQREARGLAPSRLEGNSFLWLGAARIRKSPDFSRWLASMMRLMESSFEPTSLDWMFVAPEAKKRAEAGERLHYLYKDVNPFPSDAPTPHSHGQRKGR